MSNIFQKTEQEIHDYLHKQVDLFDGIKYSEWKLKRRIALFQNHIYPNGKTDKQKRYKYWSDIIQPRVDDEVKNLRVDSDNFKIDSDNPEEDFGAVVVVNARRKQFLINNGYAESFKEDVEDFSATGNLLWKKVGKKWERCDLVNTYLTNVRARTVNDTDVIERHQYTQSQLRSKEEAGWKNIDNVINDLGDRQFAAVVDGEKTETSNPYYEIFERNGEVSEEEYMEAMNAYNGVKKGKKGDRDKFIMAKIIFAGLQKGAKDGKYVLYCGPIKNMNEVYQEAHRGAYKGKWMREGLVELLFDHQIRINEITNQLARGLEWASKTFFRSADKMLFQNLLTDIDSGSVLKSADLQQVLTRMEGFDQLIKDYERIIREADRIAHSFEIVRGEELKAGTPFRLGQLMDQNVSKIYTVLRQKLTIGYKRIFKEWILPELVGDLTRQDVIALTGDHDFLEHMYRVIAKSWLTKNLAFIGPLAANPEFREMIIEEKVIELSGQDVRIKLADKGKWKEILGRLNLSITGENSDMDEAMEDLSNFIQVEQRPGVRNYLLDRAYKLRGLSIPKSALEEDSQLGSAPRLQQQP